MSSIKLLAVVIAVSAFIVLGTILIHDFFVWITPTKDVAEEHRRQQRVGSDLDRANDGLGRGPGGSFEGPNVDGL